MRSPILTLLLLTAFLGSCKKEDSPTEITSAKSQNILLIIADDLGKDAISGFTEGSIKPTTPHIDALRTNGLTLTNLWVNPTCSPTRAAILTGKYGYRNGVMKPGDVLNNSETILHDYIRTQTNGEYATAVVGKWHLASAGTPNFNPETLGMDYFAGTISGSADYMDWKLNESGVTTQVQEYITEKFTDLAIDWVNAQDKPWFLWLAYTAPHTPFHTPPAEMHSQGSLPEYSQGMDPMPYYMAAIEAMDYQIGRVLESIPDKELENTTIIFIGDNGTPNQVAQAPYASSKAKGSLYQGGVNTPMFISGAAVGRTGADDNLITGSDLFTTISELSGINVKELHDSRSFKQLLIGSATIREFQYTEGNNNVTDQWTIRNSRFKLIVDPTASEEMYDLAQDPYETNNLLNGTLSNSQMQARNALQAELTIIRN